MKIVDFSATTIMSPDFQEQSSIAIDIPGGDGYQRAVVPESLYDQTFLRWRNLICPIISLYAEDTNSLNACDFTEHLMPQLLRLHHELVDSFA